MITVGGVLTETVDLGLTVVSGGLAGEAAWQAVHGSQDAAVFFGVMFAVAIRGTLWFRAERRKEGI